MLPARWNHGGGRAAIKTVEGLKVTLFYQLTYHKTAEKFMYGLWLFMAYGLIRYDQIRWILPHFWAQVLTYVFSVVPLSSGPSSWCLGCFILGCQSFPMFCKDQTAYPTFTKKKLYMFNFWTHFWDILFFLNNMVQLEVPGSPSASPAGLSSWPCWARRWHPSPCLPRWHENPELFVAGGCLMVTF